MLLRFDLETTPCTNPDVIEQFRAKAQASAEEALASVTAPSNYKDEAKIAEYINGKREAIMAGVDAEVQDMIDKTSFSGLYGNIACVAWAWDDEPVTSSLVGDGEKAVINRFYSDIEARTKLNYHGGSSSTGLVLAGFNIVGFDMPFLRHRSIILGIKPPAALMAAFKAKPWDECVKDSMLIWSPDTQKRVSMDNLAKALGMQGKQGFDGSMVAAAWAAGEHEKVISYCRDDVELDRAIYKRLTFQE